MRANPVYAKLAKTLLLLSLAASRDDFAEPAWLFDVQRQEATLSAKEMDRQRAENDNILACLYGITDTEFKHLLNSFNGMTTKCPEYVALLQ